MSVPNIPGREKLDFLARLTQPHLSSRRTFLQWSGATIAVLGASACFDNGKEAPSVLGPDGAKYFRVDLGSGDAAILNYAFALEQLEAGFYSVVVSNPYSGISQVELSTFIAVRDHEIAHREFLRSKLGSAALPTLLVDLKTIDLNTRQTVIDTAQTFEDLGVAAYNGAAQFLTTTDPLEAAGKIVSVEARHASAFRNLQQPYSGYSVGAGLVENGLDRAFTPSKVLPIVAPYYNNTFVTTGLPTA